MVTKGYGFTVDDIDWSSPADLKPYEKAHKLEMIEQDNLIYTWCGNYIMSAVSVAIEHCLAGKKAKLKYLKEPTLQRAIEDSELTEEERYDRDMPKALMAEEMWINEAYKSHLPQTIITKKEKKE